MVVGIIFNFTGRKLSNKADKAWEQMQENEKEINKVVDYLNKLSSAANGFYSSLKSVERIYRSHLEKLEEIEKHKVNVQGTACSKNFWQTIESNQLF